MPKRTSIALGLSLLLIILLIGVFNWKNSAYAPTTDSGQKIIYISGKKLTVDIANTPEKQTLGLSYRKSMAEDSGMLFIFPKPTTVGFWMKDMNFALDFIWIDANGKIIGIDKDILPNTYPKTFSPPSPIKYVLEVNAGWSDRNGVRIGDEMNYK